MRNVYFEWFDSLEDCPSFLSDPPAPTPGTQTDTRFNQPHFAASLGAPQNAFFAKRSRLKKFSIGAMAAPTI
jgi:hypothetical protein